MLKKMVNLVMSVIISFSCIKRLSIQKATLHNRCKNIMQNGNPCGEQVTILCKTATPIDGGGDNTYNKVERCH